MFVAIRVDGNSEIGMGHLMRCSAIAEAIVEKGGDVCFLISNDSDLQTVKATGYKVHQLKNSGFLGWSAQEVIAWIKSNSPDVLMIDSYRVDSRSLSELTKAVTTYYIDDLYAFDYPVDNIINYNIEATPKRYEKFSLAKNYYLGAKYFPVRKQIAEARLLQIPESVEKVMVTTGSTDPYNIEEGILDSIIRQYPNLNFTFQIGAFYPEGYKNRLQAKIANYSNSKFIGWTKNVGKLYADFDLIIGPGSTSLFEAMTVGIPCISYGFVDNHLDECLVLDEMNIAPYCGDIRKDKESVFRNISLQISNLCKPETRKGCAARYRNIFDGNGAERIANVLLGEKKGQAIGKIYRQPDYFEIAGVRASAILYNFLRSNHIEGKVLIPANICETVPATYLKVDMQISLCDIDFGTWLPSKKQILEILSKDKNIKVLHYNRTYGMMDDKEDFFQYLKKEFPGLIIIDDRCLAMPVIVNDQETSDLILYSTGHTKPVNVGGYAFGFIKCNYRYEPYYLQGDCLANEKHFDQSIKFCHANHTPAQMEVMLSNWMNPAILPPSDYKKRALEEYKSIIKHKKDINKIYSVLPGSLPMEYQNWRYNILVDNQEECLQALFDENLFASKHYMSLGNGYFLNFHTPNADWLEAHVINLFNDRSYSEEQSRRTVDVLLSMAKRI